MDSPSLKISKKKCLMQHGGALVEFAIVLPLLLILVFGIIEISLLFFNKAVLTNASREGARKAIAFDFKNPDKISDTGDETYYGSNDEVIITVKKYIYPDKNRKPRFISFGEGYSENNLDVEILINGDDNETLRRTFHDPPPPDSAIFPRPEVTVKVTYDYEFLVFSYLLRGLSKIDLAGVFQDDNQKDKFHLSGETTMRLE